MGPKNGVLEFLRLRKPVDRNVLLEWVMDFWTKASRMCDSAEISARGRSNPDVRPHVVWTGSTLPGRCVETH
jgi:hypothetical protein